ncbi:MAG: zinc-ribbon domain-containing protein [Erysipelotrichaceae bacterium]|nr:zinc-ribbon domain-containing protein [Erysipelotrichaceae bacterium]
MAKFCTSCGKPLEDHVTFCTECGTKLEIEKQVSPLTPQRNGVQPKVVKIPTNENKRIEKEEHIGTMYFFTHILLYSIPVVGWIYCLFAALTSSSKTKRAFARAMLIWVLIAIVACAVVYFAVQMASQYALTMISEMSGIEITSWSEITKLADSGLLSQFEALQQFGELGDVVELLDQFKNLDPSALEGIEGIDLSMLEQLQNLNP